MRDITNTTIPRVMEVLIILYAFHTTIPIFGYYVPAVVHVATVVLMLILLAVNDKFFWHNIAVVLPIFSIHILYLLYRGLSSFAIYFYNDLQLLLFPLLALYLMRYANVKTIKRILLFILASYILTAVTTYMGNLVYPMASRNLANVFQTDESYMYDVYMKMNIGGFNIIYGYVLMTPILMYLLRYRDIPVAISVIILAVFISVVMISEYTTAFLALIFTVITLLIMRKRFTERNVAIFMIALFLGVVFLDQFIFPYISRLTGIFGSEYVDSRLMELSEFSVGNDSYEGDLGARYYFYRMSLDSFWANPLWGGGSAGLGGHSFVIDAMGAFGLIGLICLIWMYRQLYRVFYKPFKSSGFMGYATFAYGLAIVLAIVNPKDNLNVLTFIIPVAASYFVKSTQKI